MFLLILCAALFLFGVFFLSIGAKVIITKRPVVISSKILRLIVLVSVSPIILKPMINATALNIFPALMWALIAFIMWKQSNGYSIFGICNPAFRQSLITTLNDLNIPFNEDMTGITIPSENILLETVSMSSGVSRIRVKGKTHAAWLRNLAVALRQHYKTTTTAITLGFSIFYLIFGILTVGFILTILMHKK